MTNQLRATGRACAMPVGLAWGGGVSLGIVLVGSGVLALLVGRETLAWENIGYGIMIMLLLSSFLGATVSAGMVKHRRLIVCLLTGLIHWLTLLAMTALFFGGQYEAVGVTAMLLFAGSGCAGLLGLRGKRGEKKRKYRYPNR